MRSATKQQPVERNGKNKTKRASIKPYTCWKLQSGDFHQIHLFSTLFSVYAKIICVFLLRALCKSSQYSFFQVVEVFYCIYFCVELFIARSLLNPYFLIIFPIFFSFVLFPKQHETPNVLFVCIICKILICDDHFHLLIETKLKFVQRFLNDFRMGLYCIGF